MGRPHRRAAAGAAAPGDHREPVLRVPVPRRRRPRLGRDLHRPGLPFRGVVLLLRVRPVQPATPVGVEHQHADRREHRLGKDQHRDGHRGAEHPLRPADRRPRRPQGRLAPPGDRRWAGRASASAAACQARLNPLDGGVKPAGQGPGRVGFRGVEPPAETAHRPGRHRRPGDRPAGTPRRRRPRPRAGRRRRRAGHPDAAARRAPPRQPRPAAGAGRRVLRGAAAGPRATRLRGAVVVDRRAPRRPVRRAVHRPVRPGRPDDRPGLRRAGRGRPAAVAGHAVRVGVGRLHHGRPARTGNGSSSTTRPGGSSPAKPNWTG